MNETEPGVTYAVVVSGKTRKRARISAGCVNVCRDADAARDASDPETGRFAAMVFGPSRSAEGQLMYYLLEWLD